ncbi:MAG: alpha/beta hydrolase [Mycobacteriaceae bacterium]|uniref:alpha/beta hydrolase n=1 Tax=Corynebacterium sp. TaxID=1720 RepID=UPI003F9C498B
MPTRANVRVTAAAVATALPLSILSVSGIAPAFAAVAQAQEVATTQSDVAPATIQEPYATRAAADADAYVPADASGWRDWVYQEDGDRYNRMEELKVHSPSMDRDIPVVTIRAKEDAANAPTIYLLNGADGGEGRANWLQQTSAIDFYGNQIGNVNVVIPMSGGFSYYTDWQEPSAVDKDGNGNGGVQKWETFLTQELPGSMEQGHLKTTSDRRSIIGMSMSASTSLVYAQQHPGLYDSIGSYSGCASTAGNPSSVDAVFLGKNMGITYEQMWGDRYGPIAHRNDALLNAGKLNQQSNVYVSNGSGLAGEHDVPSSARVGGNPLGSINAVTEGTVIEGVANVCTHMLQSSMKDEGIDFAANNVEFNFRDAGTHQWGYWQDDMFDSWPVISEGIFPGSTATAEQQTADAKAAYLANNPGGGDAGSTPLSSLDLPTNTTEGADGATE